MKSMKNLFPKKETDIPDTSGVKKYEENKKKRNRAKAKVARKSRKLNYKKNKK
jgi:hypothetical protein